MHTRVNRIAFINLNGELETISPAGEERRTLTNGERLFQFPAWSPDGTRIAAVGGTREQAGLFVFPDEETEYRRQGDPHAVYESDEDAPIYCYWSPDNEHLSFVTARAREQSMELHVISTRDDAASSLVSQPVATGQPCFWDWSLDGKRILLHTGMSNDNGSSLSFIDPFNPAGNHAPLAQPGLFQAPGIARSGRYFAFAHVNRKGEPQLVIDNRQFSQRTFVDHQGIAAMNWSPTHDQLAFISPTEPVRTYYGPLRVLDAVTQKVRTLAEDIVLAFFWSPDGKRIAYFTIANIAEQIFDAVLPNPEATAIDGGFLAYESEDEDEEFEEERVLRLNLWCVDVESGEQHLITTFEPVDLFVNQFLPFFDQYGLSHRIWSPDSTAIILPMVKRDEEGEDHPVVCVVPMLPHGGRPRVIAEGMMASWSQQ
jgi:TolB protein